MKFNIGKQIVKKDHLIENKIVSSLILSDEFCKMILPIYKPAYFQNKYFVTIVSWISEFYQNLKVSPKRYIVDIFDLKKGSLKEDEYDLIEAMLQSLSDSFDEEINYSYLYQETVKYFKIRSYQLLAEQISNAASFGSIDDAEKVLNNFKEVDRQLSGWIDPFDEKEILSTFDADDNDNLFKLPGRLGDLVGVFKRGELVGVMAPPKKGKTAFLHELCVQALLNKKKVLFISFEMNSQKTKLRFYRRLSALTNRSEVRIPVFDCLKNQTGECDNKNRKNRIALINADGQIIHNERYKVCDYCRGKPDYKMAVYFVSEKKELLSYDTAKREADLFKKWFKPSVRFKSYPPFKVKLSQVIQDIKALERTEGFIPDVIIPDYFAITAPENDNLSERGVIDVTWKMGKRIAEEFRVLMATGHQGNRASIEAKKIKQVHVSEDMRVLAHCDKMIGLSQTPEEKKIGVIRANSLISRDEDFIPTEFVTLLCNFALGQICLDSELGEIFV